MEKVKLGDICNIKSSKRIYENEYSDKGIPFYRGKEISELSRGDNPKVELYISKERFNEIEKKFSSPKKGDLLITSVGTIGNTWVSDGRKFYYKDGNITQIVNNGKINTEYLSYLFKSNILRRQYMRESTGTAQIALTIEKLNKLVIPITSLEAQEKIVAALDNAKELIDKRRAQVEALDEFIKSVFYDMFGDPIKNNKKLETIKLGEHSKKISSGSTPKGGQSVYLAQGIPLIRSQNVLMNRLIYEDIAFISMKTHENMKRSMVLKNDVLLNITGASIGRIAVYYGEDFMANVNQHVCIIRLNEDILPEYLSYLISTEGFQNNIQRMNSGATREALNYTQIKDFDILYPNKQAQYKFVEIVRNTENQRQILQLSLCELENNFNSLMQMAFKGELFN
jgi:type I restriction enzyme, S subunit